MPHLVLEYSSNLAHVVDFSQLLKDLHCTLGSVESFETDRIKSRAIEIDRFYVGRERDRGFAHVSLVFSAGRNRALRRDLGEQILDKLMTGVAPEGVKVSRSIEIRQFESGMYLNDYELLND